MQDWTWKFFIYLAKFVLLEHSQINFNQGVGGILQKINQDNQVNLWSMFLKVICAFGNELYLFVSKI